jgi:ATP synthase protein I
VNNQKSKVLKKATKVTLSKQIGVKAQRKVHARRQGGDKMWFGLGMMGLIGWSVTIPTLLGTVLGLWLDKHYSGERSWTLALLLAGLVLGCFTAWSWVNKEDKEMRNNNKDENKDD